MKVILKQDVRGVGRKFEIKNVSDGYANNFLLPKKLAEYASPEAVKKSEAQRANMQVEMEIKESLTKKQMEALNNVEITISKKANDKGHLFEKVHEAEIVEALKSQAQIELSPEFISTESPIKEIGVHKIRVEVGKNRGEFTLHLQPSSK